MKTGRASLSASGGSVQQDWRAWLPEEKALVFHDNEKYLESFYNMFSVALNEAIRMKQSACLGTSLMALELAADLCRLLAAPLAGMLRALHEHAKHYGIVPNAAPLDAANFRGQKAQRPARISGVLSRVLFSQRVQFLHKVTTLEEIVEDLDKEFRSVADELADGMSIDPVQAWDEVEADHYDLNTCLRETLILFKSFLVVLPASQLSAFETTLREQWQASGSALPVPQRATHPRRMAAFAGQ